KNTPASRPAGVDFRHPRGPPKPQNAPPPPLPPLPKKTTGHRRPQDLFVAAVSRMFSIGMDLGYTDRNPAARIERLNNPDSFAPWPLEARQKFEASEMPPWLRTAYMLALWTGQRESDVLRLARARYDGTGCGIGQGRPEAKRGKGRRGPVVTLYVPAAIPLRAYLSSCTFSGLLFVADADGRAVRADTLRKAVRAHLDRIDLDDLHFHGLRHT